LTDLGLVRFQVELAAVARNEQRIFRGAQPLFTVRDVRWLWSCQRADVNRSPFASFAVSRPSANKPAAPSAVPALISRTFLVSPSPQAIYVYGSSRGIGPARSQQLPVLEAGSDKTVHQHRSRLGLSPPPPPEPASDLPAPIHFPRLAREPAILLVVVHVANGPLLAALFVPAGQRAEPCCPRAPAEATVRLHRLDDPPSAQLQPGVRVQQPVVRPAQH
ncbi:hypothetical protein EXIGLDRAFT_657030, partial [Exidia glandulosa HHB12029]